jgi:hypothetical protein
MAFGIIRTYEKESLSIGMYTYLVRNGVLQTAGAIIDSSKGIAGFAGTYIPSSHVLHIPAMHELFTIEGRAVDLVFGLYLWNGLFDLNEIQYE